jgi:hypothetical protein
VVARFEFRGIPARCLPLRTAWLVLEKSGADVCMRDPGFDVDLVLRADIGTLARVHTGHVSFSEGLRAGQLSLEGSRALVQEFPRWIRPSHFADALPTTTHAG